MNVKVDGYTNEPTKEVWYFWSRVRSEKIIREETGVAEFIDGWGGGSVKRKDSGT